MAIILNYPNSCPECKSLDFKAVVPQEAVNEDGTLKKNHKLEHDGYFICATCGAQFSEDYVGEKGNCKLYLIGTPGGNFPWGLVPLETEINPKEPKELEVLYKYLVERLTGVFKFPEQISYPVPVDLILQKGQVILQALQKTETAQDREFLRLHDDPKTTQPEEIKENKDGN